MWCSRRRGHGTSPSSIPDRDPDGKVLAGNAFRCLSGVGERLRGSPDLRFNLLEPLEIGGIDPARSSNREIQNCWVERRAHRGTVPTDWGMGFMTIKPIAIMMQGLFVGSGLSTASQGNLSFFPLAT